MTPPDFTPGTRRRGRRPNRWLPTARDLERHAAELEAAAASARAAAAALRGEQQGRPTYPSIEALRDPAYRRGQNPDTGSSGPAAGR